MMQGISVCYLYFILQLVIEFYTIHWKVLPLILHKLKIALLQLLLRQLGKL